MKGKEVVITVTDVDGDHLVELYNCLDRRDEMQFGFAGYHMPVHLASITIRRALNSEGFPSMLEASLGTEIALGLVAIEKKEES